MFGDRETTRSITKQSVMVYGNRAVVVNNDYGPNAGSGYIPVVRGALSFGVEQFAWAPETRSLRSSWANPEVPCPNGIPGMSAPSKMMYCVGKRGNFWPVEALDWETGKHVFSQPTGEGLAYNASMRRPKSVPNAISSQVRRAVWSMFARGNEDFR